MADDKVKYLLKNIGLLGVSSFGSKVLVFLLVPLYTSQLSTTEYGTYDLVYTIIQFLLPILSLNVVDGVMRFALEEGSDKRRILGIGVLFTGLSILMTCIIAVIDAVCLFNLIPTGSHLYFILYYASYALYMLMTQFARGVDKIADMAIAGVLNTVTMLVLNICLVLVCSWGLAGFYIANILATFVPSLYLILRIAGSLPDASLTRIEVRSLTKKLIAFSAPLGIVALGWWAINLSGRLIVTALCGTEGNGLFSIAYKIPQILNVIQSVFIQAWQISAIKDFDSADRDGFFEKTYNNINSGMVLVCALLIALTPSIAHILFKQDFFMAWQYVPLLLVFVVLNTISGLWGGILSAKYDALTQTFSTVVGALVSIVFCFVFVDAIGINGAPMASVMAGFSVWIIRGRRIKKYILTDFHMGRSFVLYALLVAQAAALIVLGTTVCSYVVQLVFLLVLLVIHRHFIIDVAKSIPAKFRKS